MMQFGPKLNNVSNLVLLLDAANKNSYLGSGTTWTDISGNGNNGTLTNGPTFNSTNGGSIVFDGTNDYVSVANASSLTNTSSLSVESWVLMNPSMNVYGAVVGKGTSDANEEYCLLINPSTSKVYFDVGGTTGPYVDLTSTFNSNTWYHVVATHERVAGSSTIKIYVNGSLVPGSTINPTSAVNDNATNVSIGCRFDGNTSLWNGRISMVAIYTRTLSATEVLENYNSSKSKYNTYDPLGDLVTLYIRGVGTVGDTVIPNLVSGGTNLSTAGTVVLSDTRWKWGGTSLKISNASQINLPAYSFSGDFTLEFWYYATVFASDIRFVGGGGRNQWGWGSRVVGSRYIGIVQDAVAWTAEVVYSPIFNAWTHLAVSRSGSTIRYFHNGTLIGSATFASTFSGTSPYFEDITGSQGGAYYNDIRFTRYARYTAAFTAPTSQFMLSY
jgi:hypothetical protein